MAEDEVRWSFSPPSKKVKHQFVDFQCLKQPIISNSHLLEQWVCQKSIVKENTPMVEAIENLDLFSFDDSNVLMQHYEDFSDPLEDIESQSIIEQILQENYLLDMVFDDAFSDPIQHELSKNESNEAISSMRDDSILSLLTDGYLELLESLKLSFEKDPINSLFPFSLENVSELPHSQLLILSHDSWTIEVEVPKSSLYYIPYENIQIIYLFGHILGPIYQYLEYKSSFILELTLDNSLDLVWRPDMFVTGTVLCDTLGCMRRAYFSSLFPANLLDQDLILKDIKPMLFGSICHQIFQEQLQASSLSFDQLVQKVIDENRVSLSIYDDPHIDAVYFNECIAKLPIDPLILPDHLFGVEETYSCYTYGLKGKLDATFRKELNMNPLSDIINEYKVEYTYYPLEFKTGKLLNIYAPSFSHATQVFVYTMLLQSLWRTKVQYGKVVYLQDQSYKVFDLCATRLEISGILQKRNALILSLLHRPLPDPLTEDRDAYSCKFCPFVTQCKLGVTDNHVYESWMHALFEEEQHLRRIIYENSQSFKTKPSIVLKSSDRWTITLLGSLSDDITVGDRVILHMINPYCLYFYARGMIKHYDGSMSTLFMDRCFSSIDSGSFVVQKDDFTLSLSNLNHQRSYVYGLFHHHRNAPLEAIFSNEKVSFPMILRSEPLLSLDEFQLDSFQRTAIVSFLSYVQSNDSFPFYLWKGLAGTGKTWALSHLIVLLYRMQKSMLIVSNTNAAIDQLIHCISSVGEVSLWRLGKTENDSVSLDAAMDRLNLVDLLNAYKSRTIIVTTLTTLLHHPYLEWFISKARLFDVCIADEASQITLPSLLPALQLGRKRLLVGDEHQLPPVSRFEGSLLSKSAFEMCLSYFSGYTSVLCVQYRMHSSICHLSNTLIYNGFYQQGIPDKTLNIVDWPNNPLLLYDTADYLSVIELFCVLKHTYSVVILSPFRKQVNQLSKYCRLPVSTIDAFQGKEADIVLVILDPPFDSFKLLEDKRRWNVFMTRAKLQLVVITPLHRLKQIGMDSFIAEFISIFKTKGIINH